jgi:hypothetical protein
MIQAHGYQITRHTERTNRRGVSGVSTKGREGFRLVDAAGDVTFYYPPAVYLRAKGITAEQAAERYAERLATR